MSFKTISLFVVISSIVGCGLAWSAGQPPVPSGPSGQVYRPVMPTTAGACLESAAAGQPATGNKLFIIEAEKLIASGDAKYSEPGFMDVQGMAPFGPGWGNNAQLFWGGTLNNELVLDFDAHTAGGTAETLIDGFYEVYAHLTRAPDYGKVRVMVKGVGKQWALTGVVDTWGASVKPPPFQSPVGLYYLSQGRGSLHLKIVGKNDSSTGYLAGIDCIGVRFVKKK